MGLVGVVARDVDNDIKPERLNIMCCKLSSVCTSTRVGLCKWYTVSDFKSPLFSAAEKST